MLREEDIPPLNNALVERIISRIKELKASGYDLHTDKVVIVNETVNPMTDERVEVKTLEEIPISYLDYLGISYHLCEDDKALMFYHEYKGGYYEPQAQVREEIKSSANEVKKANSSDYTALGYITQNERAEYYKSLGYEVICSFGNSKPDIVVLKNGVYQFVVSVKCFSLDKERNNGHTNSRTIQRKDTMPEINEAIRLNVPLKLDVCNLLNGKWETKTLDAKSFILYSTSSEIAKLEIATP